jgi:hypothetical protein
VLGDDLAVARRTASLAANWLAGGVWADGYDIHADSTPGVRHDVPRKETR